ncbi:MAG: hypothetical protein LUP91_15065 [Methylococcaceae bacterium]|nr:hypothetical protein [Methylococcaceae bacterium]
MRYHDIRHIVSGPTAIHQCHELVAAMERLQFIVDEIAISGTWDCNGAMLQLGRNVIGLPRRKAEIAPGVWASPTEWSVIEISGRGERVDE